MALLKRKHTPPPKRDVSYYKESLRKDFDHRCAYCKNHEAVEGGSKNFEIDHYKPLCKFRGLKFTYSNLFYSCKECNRTKWSYYPNSLQMGLGEYILNPCDHDFEEHYDMNDPEWKGKTVTAFWNITKLRLNSPRRVKVRKDEIFALSKIDELSSNEKELLQIISDDRLQEPLLSEAKEDLVRIQDEIAFYRRKTIEITD